MPRKLDTGCMPLEDLVLYKAHFTVLLFAAVHAFSLITWLTKGMEPTVAVLHVLESEL